MNKEIVNPNPPDNYAICHSESCSLRGHCLHAQVAQRVISEAPTYLVINSAHPSYREGADCSYYRPDAPELYARGFAKGMNELSRKNYDYCTQHLLRCYSKPQYYRLKRGDRPLSPEEQSGVLEVLHHYGYEGESPFDEMEWRYTW
ncbi:DUF6078 family protein [Porphyromonas somerae]|uniref:DUF6078 family protein n=1 Tax=Porphyromonas somerae TaxID=322095 RepID=UPI002A807C9B|nr:DUF6078 family protein [Porphyromonas somerae]MDY3884466.1 DUF6078 family protein [Porphyromonas somerae]